MYLVRPAELSDLAAAAVLFDQYRQFYGQPSDAAAAERFLRERLERKESAIFLAVWNSPTSGNAPVGFMQLYPLFSSVRLCRVWLLNDLFVAATHRGQGIGALLLRHAVKFGRAAGAARLQLETGVENTGAQRLYEAEGWSRDSSGFHYYIQIDE